MRNRLFPRRIFLLIAIVTAFLLRTLTSSAAAADPKEVFTVVLLPDTQFYSEKYPDTYVQQTLWIRSRVKEDNLKFSIGLGDIVQNAHQEQEWKNANVAASHLDGVLPYSIVPGNHDQASKGRSEERRVGKEGRNRRTPGHKREEETKAHHDAR